MKQKEEEEKKREGRVDRRKKRERVLIGIKDS